MDLIFRLDIIYCYDYGASLEAELYNLSVKFSPLSTSDPSDIISLDTTRRSSTSPIYLLAPLRYSTQLQLNLFGSSRPYSLDADLSYPYLGSVRTSCSVKLAPLGFIFTSTRILCWPQGFTHGQPISAFFSQDWAQVCIWFPDRRIG